MRTLVLVAVLTLGVEGCTASHSTVATTSSPASSARITEPASFARSNPATPGSGPAVGTIAGPLGYPADGIPPLTVYAISSDGKRFYTVETVQDQSRYTMLGVQPGDYYIYATQRWPQVIDASGARTQPAERFGGGYTAAVLCGESVNCNDHSMIAVHVVAGATTDNIDPSDWYVGPDFYPTIPAGGPPPVALPSAGSVFPDATAAGVYYAQFRSGGAIVPRQAACPVNVACVSTGPEHDGTAAAYLPATAGSNQDLQACGVYLFHDDAGWHEFEFICRLASTPFPAVGSSGRLALGFGESPGCINIHSSPDLSAGVVSCLNPGTAVTIDDGPVYAPNATAANPYHDRELEYWWHVAGRGWVVHRYLRYGG